MQPEQQQRITAYFIEEAKEHLATIDQGLSNLQATVDDPEAVSEVYRAAHSIKGGAAMLGFTGIQTVAHRLEDFFKVLRETPVRSDQRLESLFTAVYNVLAYLVSVLEQNGTLTAEEAQSQLAAVEPTITQLRNHLNALSTASPVHAPTTVTAAATSSLEVRSTMPEHSALLLTFQSDVPAQLREMLQLFKQGDSYQTRQALQDCCQRLSRIGEQFDLSRWIELLNLSQRAIAHEANSYRTLAQVVIKSIKQAQDLVLADQANMIAPGDDLKALVPASVTPSMNNDESLDDLLSIGDELLTDNSDHYQNNTVANLAEWPESQAKHFDFPGVEADMPSEILPEADDGLRLSDAPGPEVDIAELNILADMFEDEALDLGAGWADDDSFGSFSGFPTDVPDTSEDEDMAELSDLLFQDDEQVDSSPDDLTTDGEILRLFGDNTLIQKDDETVDNLTSDESRLELDDVALGLLVDSGSDLTLDLEEQLNTLHSSSDENSSDDVSLVDLLPIASDPDAVTDDGSSVGSSLFMSPDSALEEAWDDLALVFGEANGTEPSDASDAALGDHTVVDEVSEIHVSETLVETDPFNATVIEAPDTVDYLASSELDLDLNLDDDNIQIQSGMDLDLDMGDLFGDADAEENLPEVADFNLGLESLNSVNSGSDGNIVELSLIDDPEAALSSLIDQDLAPSLEEFDIGELELASEAEGASVDANRCASGQDAELFSTRAEDNLLMNSQQIPDDLFTEDQASSVVSPLAEPDESSLLPDESNLFEPQHSDVDLFDLDASDLVDAGDLVDTPAIDLGPSAPVASEMPDELFDFDLDALMDDEVNSATAPATDALDSQLGQNQSSVPEDFDLSDFSDLSDFLTSGDDIDTNVASDALLDLTIVDDWLADSATDASSEISDLDDLDLLIDAGSSTPDLSEFGDLDGLLSDSASEHAVTSSLVSENTDSPVQDFSDLDAMLEEPAPDTVPSVKAGDSQPEFDDLEALLQDANRSLGGQPATMPSRSATPPRRPQRAVEPTMRVPVKQLDKLNNLVGELVVNRNSLEQDQDRLRQFLDNLLYQVQQLSDVGQRMRDLYERSLLESSLLASRQAYQAGPKANSGTSTHSTGADFDALEMDRFTAFHSLSQEMIELIVRVRESASDIEYIIQEPMDQVTRNFRQVTTQLQEELNRARMVPFSITADRLPRGVRDNAIKEGKQAELIVEGRDTLIDKMILEQLTDPLTHLVNNAIAHGIEKPEVRQAAGKSPVGRITVRAFHQGNQTVISVSDDGAGINPEFIKKKAIEKGLITPAEAKNLSKSEIYEILFLPGFSGAEKLTDLAGRGVGMDVVRTTLNEIRGTISIDSTLGKGTTFTIRLPLTLSISKALCCISNRARIAFPMDGVEDMFDVPRDRVQLNDQGQPCIPWRDTMLPFQPLSDILKFNRFLGRGSVYGGGQEDDIIPIVVLRSAGNYIALQVDQVMGEQEIVIKQLQGPVPKPMGIAGATVLGDGRIMPIADVLELIDLSMGRLQPDKTWEAEDVVQEPEDTPHEPTVLIVDDSITVRELLSMTFAKVGFRVEQARDGQDAWEKLRSGLPCDIVFCDIEMPRMDGLELLSRIQKDSSLNHLPIAMLTSRGADRHRQMAIQMGARGYFTKPYLEEVLLDAAQRMLKGEVLVAPAG